MCASNLNYDGKTIITTKNEIIFNKLICYIYRWNDIREEKQLEKKLKDVLTNGILCFMNIIKRKLKKKI